MRTAVISFTARGQELSRRIKEKLGQEEIGEISLYTKCSRGADRGEDICFLEGSLKEWTQKRFAQKELLIFVGACGIAVRSIAPCLRDKLEDSPVLVVDEGGSYVIPILSGHYGAGNEWAGLLAKCLDAVPVITTATDVNGLFAADVFAKKNHLVIRKKEGIARVSAKILDKRHITIWVDGAVCGVVPAEVELLSARENMPPEIERLSARGNMPPEIERLSARGNIPAEIEWLSARGNMPPEIERLSARGNMPPDIAVSVRETEGALLQLCPKAVILGMGCKKGKSSGAIETFVTEQLKKLSVSLAAVRALATIECKGEEPGLLAFAKKYSLPLLTFSGDILNAVEGDFSASAFVKKQVGVDNVCERAAVAAAQAEKKNVKILQKKTVKDGMTLAIAEEEWSVTFDEA